ncbi:rhomboid family intramembrane serine protease [Aquisphaera insulae]|uniref:rhomboid family intramembrane serine protease n=1 Tax=Aquisphaera insulae TaxID=2712864 RepID=UPI0013EDC748|nr:rhomboid family intramembrane serine protease [Aquisphaera insulae]
MRQIGTLPKHLDAKVIEDYLLSRGIKTRFDRTADGWAVWVINEDHVARGRQELDDYIGRPDDPRFTESLQVASAIRSREAKLDRQYRKNYREVADGWGGLQASRRPVTVGLVAVSIVVFLLLQSAPRRRGPDAVPGIKPVENLLLFSPVHVDPKTGDLADSGLDAILGGEVWRLVTPIFLHFSFMHILFNCWATMVEGTLIETRKGTLRLLILVLVSAILSNAGQYLYGKRMDPDEVHLFGGLSGVGYALFGYLWMKGQFQPEEGMILHPNTISTMLIWLVLCMTGMLGPIANAAHVVGLLVGIIFGVLRY